MNKVIYVITCEGQLLFVTNDANVVIEKSIEYCADQHEHDVELWIGSKKVGTIELNGEIQKIYK